MKKPSFNAGTLVRIKDFQFEVFSLVELAQLNTFELKRLLKCILKSSFVANDIKTLLFDFKESL